MRLWTCGKCGAVERLHTLPDGCANCGGVMTTQHTVDPVDDDTELCCDVEDPAMLIRKWHHGGRLNRLERELLDEMLLLNRVGLLVPSYPMQEAA